MAMLNMYYKNIAILYFLGFFSFINLVSIICVGQTERASTYTGGANLVAGGLSGFRTNAVSNEISMDGVGKMGGSKLLYTQIKGSPFLSDGFQMAVLYSADDKSLGNYLVKYNLASQQFHFLDHDSTELVVPENLVAKIVMVGSEKQTPKTFSNVIKGISMNGIIVDKYVEILADGSASFLKYTYKHVISKESSLNPVPEYSFATSTNYFIRVGSQIKFIKKLNEENVLEMVPQKNENHSKVNYNFKNESDVAAYIANWNKISVDKK
jgi:hypothetical protein